MSLLSQNLATRNIDIWIDTAAFPYTQFKYPSCCLFLYLLATFYFQPHATPKIKQHIPSSSTKPEQKSLSTLKLFIFLHNVILCIFSAFCFYRTFPVVASVFHQHGFEGASCGQLQSLYANGIDSVFGYWAYLFYLSKIYEFIDTFIVIARGRRPIFLQTFHHVGAVLVCVSGNYLFENDSAFEYCRGCGEF